jgi:hypothetical protein
MSISGYKRLTLVLAVLCALLAVLCAILFIAYAPLKLRGKGSTHSLGHFGS